MTYIELINNVLIRLREDTIESGQVDSDPYLRSIGAHVNDAKDRVEDAWQWGALRGTDTIVLATSFQNYGPYYGGGTDIQLPDSADNHYTIKRMLCSSTVENTIKPGFYDPDPNSTRNELRQITVDQMRERYRTPAKAGAGRPTEFAVTGQVNSPVFGSTIAGITGSIKVTLWPFPTPISTSEPPEWAIEVDRVNHQGRLSQELDILKVPSLPVYSLATALASRERGEVGGTPTSELFAIADRHLSDAIAQDSALYANEMIWYDVEYPSQTNWGNG